MGTTEVERDLEGTPRAFDVCVSRQTLDRWWTRPATEQRGLVVGPSQKLFSEQVKVHQAWTMLK